LFTRARPGHRAVRGFVVAIRRSGHQPDAVEAAEIANLRAVGGHPDRFDAAAEHRANGVDLAMARVCLVLVADHGDADAHANRA
jgi:hypothetical protein